MLRCCGGDGDGRPSGRSEQLRWQRNRRRLLRGDGDPPSSGAADHGGGGVLRQEYRRVSGRTASTSVELSSDGDRTDVDTATATAATTAVGLAECWRRALNGSAAGAGGGGGCLGAGSGRPGNDVDDDAEDCCCGCCCGYSSDNGSTTPVRDGRLPAAVLSNWTMISNSSLRDVDGDDLRDELVGYAVNGTPAIISAVAADDCDGGGVKIFVGDRSHCY